MQFQYSSQLVPLLESIELTILATLPKTIRDLEIMHRAYAIFLLYHDSSAIDFSPRFAIGTHHILQQCEIEDSQPESRFACVWSPQQLLGNVQIPAFDIGTPALQAQCNQAYTLMLAANKSGLPLPDESEILMPFRSMLRRCAARLNEIDWANELGTDDPFVVVALDSMSVWVDEDLQACIPARKVTALLKRGLLL